MDYVNTSMTTIGVLETSLLESYTSVVGNNYTNDNALYTELKLKTLNRAQALNSEAIRIGEALTDEEIKEVHDLYVSYSAEFLEALNLLKSAIEQKDLTISAQATEKLNSANTFAQEYQARLQSLAEEYEVELNR